MTTGNYLPFTVRDNVPGCTWLLESSDLHTLFNEVWEHIIAAHPDGPDASPGRYVSYTHVPCGQDRASELSMRSHLNRGCPGDQS